VRCFAGVTRAFLSQSSGLPRRPVIMPAGRNSPEPPGSKGDEPLPAGTVSLRPPASPTGVLYESEILSKVTEMGTIVKKYRYCSDQGDSAPLNLQRPCA
jgi:hypothetical protein